MIYILVLVLVIITTLVGIALVFYEKNTKKNVSSNTAPVSISNPGYKMFVDLESQHKKMEEFRKIVPSYVSKDIYKEIPVKTDRDKKFLDDYFYLLDLAIRSYQANPKNVSEIMTKEVYLPILVWAKFTVDYDKYLRSVDASVLEKRFISIYGKTPNINATMSLLRSVQDIYIKDHSSINRVIFGSSVTQESLIPRCNSYEPVEKIVYQELHITKPSTDVCSYAMHNNTYLTLPKEVQVRKFPADFWMLLRLAIKTYEDNKPTFDNVMKQEKYITILVFSRFAVKNQDFVNSLPSEITNMYISQNSDLLAKKEAMKFIDTFVIRYKANPSEIDAIIYKQCHQNTSCNQDSASVGKTQEPVKKESNSYISLPVEQRNAAVMYDFLNVFKNAVEAILSNKAEMLNAYKARKSDTEFLKLYSFTPALLYAKFIEDNKDYLNQVDPIQRKQQLVTLYPDFMTNERFYIEGVHIQVFLIIASNLYIGSPRNVDLAIYGTVS